MNRLIILLGSILLYPFLAFGQGQLQLGITHFYSYDGTSIPLVLNRLPADPVIEAQISTILESAEETSNFIAIPANVSCMITARAGENRYLLYNPNFLINLDYEILSYAILAHGIGHHVNQNRLAPVSGSTNTARATALQTAEYILAEQFVGYIIKDVGASNLNALPALIEALPLVGLDKEEHRLAIIKGDDRKTAFLAAGSSGWHGDEDFPRFPFPPPKSSGTSDLTHMFSHQRNMGGVASQTKAALNECGYFEHQYYYTEGGFAMVTRIEQYKNDGVSLTEPARWSAKPHREEGSWADYLRNLFTSNPGHFRVFVFVVTDKTLTQNTEEEVSVEIAKSWLSGGANRLPNDISNQSFGGDTTVTALIYDFLVEDTTRKAVLSDELSPQVHLIKSNIINALRR